MSGGKLLLYVVIVVTAIFDLQCRRTFGGGKLQLYVLIVVAAIFDFMTEED